MREYARIREVAEGDVRLLRQLSIVQFAKEDTAVPVLRKIRGPAPPAGGNSPPDTIWAGGDQSERRKLRWGLPMGVLDMGAVPFVPRWAPSVTTLKASQVAPTITGPVPKIVRAKGAPWRKKDIKTLGGLSLFNWLRHLSADLHFSDV